MEAISHASKDHNPVAEVVAARTLTSEIMARAAEIEAARRVCRVLTSAPTSFP